MKRRPFPMPVLLLALVFLLLTGRSATAQLMMVQDTAGCGCTGLKVDTTGISTNFFPNGPYPTGRIYAKQYWHVELPSNALRLGYGAIDSIITVSWTAIDTSFHALRDSFQVLESAYGVTLTLRKVYPTDTTGLNDRIYWLSFDEYLNTDSIAGRVSGFPGVTCAYIGGIKVTLSVPNDMSLKPNTPISDIQMGSADLFWEPYFHKLGWQWGFYKMNLPMAWEITTGRPEVVIGDHDCFIDKGGWNVSEATTHPDLVLRDATHPSGNFIRIDAASQGNGSTLTLPLGIDHGLGVLSCAVAKGNNDNPSVAGEGMLGTCYNCSGMALNWNQDARTYVNVDADGVKDVSGAMRRIAVMNCSYEGISVPKEVFEAGIVVVAAGANFKQQPTNNSPAADIFTPVLSDPSKDYKPIAVGGVSDGILYDAACNEWYDMPTGVSRVGHPMYKGAERFMRGFNFSTGTDKFNLSTTGSTRNNARSNAFMDLTAPTGHTMYAVDGPSSCPDPSKIISGCNFGEQIACGDRIIANQRKYMPNGEGTSYASPEVAGICGLMLSVSRFMGVTVNSTTGLPTDGPEVQRRVYDILTFTADKIADNGWVPTGNTAPTQPGYVSQTNDTRNRTWAQRMGFGRVNAYRAVAHSILQKGAYSYGTSQTLTINATDGGGSTDGYSNESGLKLMHFGSWKNATDKVLVAGGESLPGESHNNQGVTKINGTGTTITVPNSSILAIDGKVMTDNATGNNKITTGTNSGKILITGYLEDVEVNGVTRVADLIVNSTGTTTVGRLATGASSATSEIYGTVTLINKGVLSPDQGTMTLKPGGSINMTGVRDVVVENGATLKMEYASSILGSSGRKVLVKSGSTLIVDDGAKVDILCRVEVESGGQFIIGQKAFVTLNEFYVQRGGAITLNQGSRLHLNKQLQNTCYGKFTSAGTSTNRVTIKGHVIDCCKAICEESDDYASILVQDQQAATNPTNVTDCFFNMKFTDVSNVAVKTVDAPLYTVNNDSFSARRTLYPTTLKGQTLLTILRKSNARPLFTVPGTPDRDVASISNCKFYDESQGITTGARKNHTYFFTGLRTEFLRRLTVNNSKFKYLQYGSSSLSEDLVVISNSTFDTSNYGIFDIRSTMKICSNTIHWTDFGAFVANNPSTRLYDNSFQLTRNGFSTQNGGPTDVRSNTFNEYMQALVVSGTNASLNSRQVVQTPSKVVANGRNIFTVSGSTSYAWGNQAATSFDILMTSKGSVLMNCGYNNMARNSRLHFFSTNAITLTVGNNKFNDPSGNFIVRKSPLVTTLGAPLNTSATLGAVCDSIVTTTFCTPTSGSAGGWCKDWEYRYVNDGYWSDYGYSSSFLREAFDSGRYVMRIDTFDAPCRIVKARDALNAAVLGDSTNYKLRLLTNDFTTILASSYAPTEVKSAVLMLKGEAHQYLGEPDSATIAYNALTTYFTSSVDSLPAAWQSQYLAAAGSDSTYGAVYDSTMGEYHLRVLNDMRRRMVLDSVGFKPVTGDGGSAEISSATTLEQNIPNPFMRETEIGFTVGVAGNVRLVVVDVRGELVRTLVDGPMKPGRHTVTMATGELPAGTYYYRLECGGVSLSRSMVITR